MQNIPQFQIQIDNTTQDSFVQCLCTGSEKW